MSGLVKMPKKKKFEIVKGSANGDGKIEALKWVEGQMNDVLKKLFTEYNEKGKVIKGLELTINVPEYEGSIEISFVPETE